MVERAIDILSQARRPIVVTGSGVLWSGASEEMRRFIDATGLPFWTTPQGRGVVPEDHPRVVHGRALDGVSRSRRGAGDRRAGQFDAHLFAARRALTGDAKFINVNVDGKEIGHNREVEIGIIGDAKLVLQQLTAAAAGKFRPQEETPWISELSAKQRSNQERDTPLLHSDKVPIHPLRLCKEVREIIVPRYHPGDRWPRDFEFRPAIDSQSMRPEPASTPVRTDAWVSASRSESAPRRRPRIGRCWCFRATARSAGTEWRWTRRSATTCRSWW